MPKPEMDPAVRAFLDRLDPDDVALLEKTIGITRKLLAFGQVGKWILYGLFGLVIAISLLGEAVQKIFALVKNGFN